MNKQERLQKRRDNLMPNGVPKWIRIYDNGGLDIKNGSFDRYTVIFTHAQSFRPKHDYRYAGWFPVLAMSDNPCHPQGFCLHNEYTKSIDQPAYSHLGKKINFEDLPEDCRKVVIDDYMDYWNLKE